MNIAPTKKELIAQAEASEAALRAIWQTVADRLSPRDLHAADRASDAIDRASEAAASLSTAATSAAGAVAVKMRANPYATGLIGAGALLLLFGATRSADTQRKTVAEAQAHPVAATIASLALGAGVAAILPQNRSRLLALLPAAGVVMSQLRRMFQVQPEAEETPPPAPAKRKAATKRTAAAKAAATPAKSAPKRTRKAPAAKPAATAAAETARANGATVN